jgi:phosphatidylserine/phosphatidylglycerophosphate/cardiolipin synthase-like enzyme
MSGGRGLTDVATSTLEQICDEVAVGRLRCPLETGSLHMCRRDAAETVAAATAGLDAASVKGMLTTVIAERHAPREPEVELVWTGPDTPASVARDTRVVLRQLFADAHREVIVVGYCFDHGERILEPLHAAMRHRGVRCSIVLDVPRVEPSKRGDEVARKTAERFLADNWPFGPPVPALYYDPRCADPSIFASVHAKCVVVDGSMALVSSANFTDRGQSRNIEVGVLVTGPAFAGLLQRQLVGLMNAELLLPISG